MMPLIPISDATSDTRKQLSPGNDTDRGGYRVLRFLKTRKVKVTGHDIRWGQKEEPMFCPLARPIWNLGACFVEVEANFVKLRLRGHDYRREFIAPLSVEAQRFVKNFDNGEKVFPSEFRLHIYEVEAR